MSPDSKPRSGKSVEVELASLASHGRRRVALSPEEFRALSGSWRIERSCGACNRTSEWTSAEAVVESEDQLDFWDWLATTVEYFVPEEAAPPDQRRRERRVEMHAPLLVFSGDFEEEVASENISKNSVALWSARAYWLGETIWITLQPPRSAGPQAKRAVIGRANPPVGGKVLYGARLSQAAHTDGPPGFFLLT